MNWKLWECQMVQKVSACQLRLLESIGVDIVNLYLRLWLGFAFWKSAATKVQDVTTVSPFGFDIPLIHLPYSITQSTYMLFEYEFGMPYPELSALLATFAEVLLPLMLLFGFGSRIAALGLFIMTVVIELTYGHDSMHMAWWMVSAVLVTAGPGRFSADNIIRQKVLGK